MGLAESTARELVWTLCRQEAGEHPLLRAPYDDAADFAWRQATQIAGYLRVPLRVLTALMGLSPLFRHGAVFAQLPRAQKEMLIRAWTRSPLAPVRDWMRLYENLARLALFDRLSRRSVPRP